MADAIFLAAGVPDPKRGPEYAATADVVAIGAAVSALLHVTLGRRPLVWGGQPAITPMIWAVAEGMGVDYGRWVKLYQSRHFQEDFPEENARFGNVVFTEDVGGGREESLLAMRERMFADNAFSAAVFIGGMGGLVQEYEMFRQAQPRARIVPIVSTGGATLKIAELMGGGDGDLASDLDYVRVLHRHLGVSAKEARYASPDDQPRDPDQRHWRPGQG